MRDSVPNPRHSPVCNVLHQWKTSLNPTYRVYRLYDRVYGLCYYLLLDIHIRSIQTYFSKLLKLSFNIDYIHVFLAYLYIFLTC